MFFHEIFSIKSRDFEKYKKGEDCKPYYCQYGFLKSEDIVVNSLPMAESSRIILKAMRKCKINEKAPVRCIPKGYPGKMTRFPEELLTEGPCEMPVTTYVFWFPFDSVEHFEKACKSIPRRDFQFLTCCVERDERGKPEGQGIVQYDKELHSFSCTQSPEYMLRYKFGHCARFFHQIQDANVNNAYRYIKKREVQAGIIKTFKRGAFVGLVDIDLDVTELRGEMSRLTI